jgi:hypothetical protein
VADGGYLVACFAVVAMAATGTLIMKIASMIYDRNTPEA